MKERLLIFILFACLQVTAQDKAGMVNSQSLLERLPSRDSFIKLIMEREAVYLEELNDLDSALNSFTDRMWRHHGSFDPFTTLYNKNKLKRLQDDIYALEMEMDLKMQQWGNECNQRSLKIIHEAVKKVSLNLGLDVIFDSSVLMYFAEELNITEAVFTEMIKIDESPR